MTSTSTTTEGKYSELKEELLRRHKQELEEFEDCFRRENQILVVQASHLSDKPNEPFSLEIIFPLSPSSREIGKVCESIDKALKASLVEIGYKLTWKEPKTWE